MVVTTFIFVIVTVLWTICLCWAYQRLTSDSGSATRAVPDRHLAFRLEADQPVTVFLLGDEPSLLYGRVIDLSSSGVRFEAERALPVGSTVRLSFDNYDLLAEVRYCFPASGLYRVGVELREALISAEEFVNWLRTG